MKTRLLIIIGIVVFAIFVALFFGSSLIFDSGERYQVLDVEMSVVGVKQFYNVGEPLNFSVHVNSLGNTVPWPTLRIYQNYVDISSDPVYSRMYMTPIEPGDKQNPVEWREKTWNFPLESDDSIRFFENGNYTLRVDIDGKKHVLINFQVVENKEQCNMLGGNLVNFDTCVIQEEKWMACHDIDPVDNACIIDGMKIKVAKNEN